LAKDAADRFEFFADMPTGVDVPCALIIARPCAALGQGFPAPDAWRVLHPRPEGANNVVPIGVSRRIAG